MVSGPAALPPVFIHSWWRTASTYVRNKFRRHDFLCCYTEPLHEAVGHLTLEIVRAPADPQVIQRLHHPPSQRSYFIEYEPLLLRGGTGFRKAFSYDRYFLGPRERNEELEQYLARLIGVAQERGKRPVLACVRSSLRAAWMKRHCGGLHLALLRNPRDQWGSMLEQNFQGGTYFLAGVIAIAAKLSSRFPRSFDHIPYELKDYRERLYNPAELGRYLALAQKIEHGHSYALFTLIWLASALQILSVAHVVLDSDRLSVDAGARAAVETRLAAAGLPVDFSDCAAPHHHELPLAPDALDAIEAAAAKALAAHARPLAIVNPVRVESSAHELAPASAQLVRLAVDELRRSGFFVKARQAAT